MSKMTEKEFNQQIIKWGEAGFLDNRENEIIGIAVDFELADYIGDEFVRYCNGQYDSCGLTFKLHPIGKINGMQLL